MKKRPHNKEQHCREVLGAIKEYWAEHNSSPAVREIGQAIGINSSSQIKFYLDELEQQKKIIRTKQKTRNIFLPETENKRLGKTAVKVLDSSQSIVAIPDYGPIAAGTPIHLPDASYKKTNRRHPETTDVHIPESYLPQGVKVEDVFALHVEGDSMRDAMLINGDIVILMRTTLAELKGGEIVATWIKDTQETTLKRFEKTPRGISLKPENPNYKSLFFLPDEVDIQGKLLAVLRFRY